MDEQAVAQRQGRPLDALLQRQRVLSRLGGGAGRLGLDRGPDPLPRCSGRCRWGTIARLASMGRLVAERWAVSAHTPLAKLAESRIPESWPAVSARKHRV